MSNPISSTLLNSSFTVFLHPELHSQCSLIDIATLLNNLKDKISNLIDFVIRFALLDLLFQTQTKVVVWWFCCCCCLF